MFGAFSCPKTSCPCLNLNNESHEALKHNMIIVVLHICQYLVETYGFFDVRLQKRRDHKSQTLCFINSGFLPGVVVTSRHELWRQQHKVFNQLSNVFSEELNVLMPSTHNPRTRRCLILSDCLFFKFYPLQCLS